MSARAAWRLVEMEFADVYCYAAGKADWRGAGLPMEGTMARFPRLDSALHRDVPTCRPSDTVLFASEQANARGLPFCIVVNPEGVVLGRLSSHDLHGPDDASVEDVMDPGPSTSRPSDLLAEVAVRLAQAGVEYALVTDSDGKLMGVVSRVEAERLTGVVAEATAELVPAS